MATIANKPIGPIGFGMMSLTNPAKGLTTPEAIAVLKAALESGATFWNGGLIYGSKDSNSCHLLNAYFTQYPADASRVCISIKGCFDSATAQTHCDVAGVRASIDDALKVLDGKCHIDVFQPARVDRNVPIEETVEAIAAYVKQGLVGGIGLSECSAATIRRAAAVHPIAAVEVEMSLFSTDILTNGVAEACKESNIPIVAYSPLGRGFLSGAIRSLDDIPENDFRRMFYPRFQPENFDANIKLVDEVEAIAKKKGCTVAQVAIAWVAMEGASMGSLMVPIPGASNVERVKENSFYVKLDGEEFRQINSILEKIEIKGGRAPERFAHLLEG